MRISNFLSLSGYKQKLHEIQRSEIFQSLVGLMIILGIAGILLSCVCKIDRRIENSEITIQKQEVNNV